MGRWRQICRISDWSVLVERFLMFSGFFSEFFRQRVFGLLLVWPRWSGRTHQPPEIIYMGTIINCKASFFIEYLPTYYAWRSFVVRWWFTAVHHAASRSIHSSIQRSFVVDVFVCVSYAWNNQASGGDVTEQRSSDPHFFLTFSPFFFCAAGGDVNHT